MNLIFLEVFTISQSNLKDLQEISQELFFWVRRTAISFIHCVSVVTVTSLV